jgi:hypothetical protein
MKRFRSTSARFILVPLMATTVLSACTYWKVTEMSPSRAVAEEDWVLLTTSDGDKIMIVDPVISDGQIEGHPVRGQFAVKSDTVRVPVDSVVHIQVREISAALTTFGVLVALVPVAFFAYVIAALSAY